MPESDSYEWLDELLAKLEEHYLKDHPDPDQTRECYWRKDARDIIAGKIAARDEAVRKEIIRSAGDKFDELCKRARNEPNFGNSSKGKKDNFLDGAEIMLTSIQAVAAIKEKLGER